MILSDVYSPASPQLGFELTPGGDVEDEVEASEVALAKPRFELTPGEDVEAGVEAGVKANEIVLTEEPIFELIPGEDEVEANNIVITEAGLGELLGVVGCKGFW
jgi:hypothetical protein